MNYPDADAYLDEPLDGDEHAIYFNRDGTPARTRRESLWLLNGIEDRVVMQTRLEVPRRRRTFWDFFRPRQYDQVLVSTVFLVINHAMRGRPLIFETMIFGGDHAEWMMRYSTEAEALLGHSATLEWLMGRKPEPTWLDDL